MKKISIVLIDNRENYPNDEKPFKVKSITNSVAFKVNEYLTRVQVMDLCNMEGYDVKLVSE